jgi:tRNA G26 N,N-dimethylase Trm1
MLVLSKNEIKTKRIKKDGKFNTYKIDEIIEKILSVETGDLMINDWLTNKLELLEKAVEDNKKDEIRAIVKELKTNLPRNSGFHDYIDILTDGLIK